MTLWTQERDDTLRRIAEAGEPASVAAAALGVTRNACIGRAGRIGIRFLGGRRKTVAEKPITVVTWTKDRKDALCRLLGEGKSARECGEIGVGPKSVEALLNRQPELKAFGSQSRRWKSPRPRRPGSAHPKLAKARPSSAN